jgi:hypothetical protein
MEFVALPGPVPSLMEDPSNAQFVINRGVPFPLTGFDVFDRRRFGKKPIDFTRKTNHVGHRPSTRRAVGQPLIVVKVEVAGCGFQAILR